MHSLEIIVLQFEKECHILLCILELHTNIVHELLWKNAWLPPMFFLGFNNTWEDLPFLHNHKSEQKYL